MTRAVTLVLVDATPGESHTAQSICQQCCRTLCYHGCTTIAADLNPNSTSAHLATVYI